MSQPENRPHQQGINQDFSPADLELLDKLDRPVLYGLLNQMVRSIWRVDGLYFLGIEKRHGTEEATQVDAECWRYLGKAEARELKALLGIHDPGPAQALELLRHTSWALSHHFKSQGLEPDGAAFFSVDKCRTQLIRLDKGLEPHPCLQVRRGYLEAFVQECNPRLALETVSCPPQRTREDLWCLWRLRWA